MTAFSDAGCTQCDTVNVSSTQDHTGCAQFAVLYAKGFFESLRTIDSCAVNAVNGVPDIDFTVYPNPAKEQVTVQGNLQAFSKFYAIDLLGRKRQLSFRQKDSQLLFSVRELENGYYILIGESSAGKKTIGHFIKHN